MATKNNGSMVNGSFTPVQRRIVDLLSDGMPHTAAELHGCLHDELGPIHNISAHLTGIRKVLRPKGEDVSFQRNGGVSYYVLVRLLRSPSAE